MDAAYRKGDRTMDLKTEFAERLATITAAINAVDGATDAEQLAILSKLNHCVFLLTGQRQAPIIKQGAINRPTKTDKRECVPCKQKMLDAVKKAGEIVNEDESGCTG